MTITRLIKTDADANNNKFWEAVLDPNGDKVMCRWGRVGANGQRKTFNGGQHYIDRKVKEKTSEGYVIAQVVGGGETITCDTSAIKTIARQQIVADKETVALVDELVAWNIHNITQKSTMTVSVSSGTICLPSGLGVLTQSAIDEARRLLNTIGSSSRTNDPAGHKTVINKYLSLVPQIVPRKRGWINTIFSTPEEIAAQEHLLDSLQATIQTLTPTQSSKVFDVTLNKLQDGNEVGRITRLYDATRQNIHQSCSLRPINIYKITMGAMRERYNKCQVGNPMELWHGTGVGNLLSILKCGLIIPSHASHGRNFGNGIYLTDQSTKALNYAAGYWDGRREKRCFMFLANVKMGRPYTPGPYDRSNFPRSGYDSVYAKAGFSGILNNEMIVYDTDRVDLTFIVEFSERAL
jgi:poly [ADP-ribose] polymerase